MGHRIIIGTRKAYVEGEPQPKAEVNFEWEPDDSMTVQEQTEQYRKMLKLYLKALHVADPEHHSDPGE